MLASVKYMSVGLHRFISIGVKATTVSLVEGAHVSLGKCVSFL